MNFTLIGKTIRKKLIDLDMSQKDLSVETDLSIPTIRTICQGRKVSADTILKIGNYLKKDLFNLTED